MASDTVSQSEPSDFKLGDWWVRPQRNELERSEAIVQVEARSMSVLVCLARHAPRVVGKERLVEEVWSDSPFIGDDAISHAIWELRKALGDSARDSVYIQTVPRKGYCIVAEILRPQGAPLPLVGARIDHYELGRELGRGAMGVVYEAVDHKLGRTVAIKFVAPELTRDPQACGRFEREARLAATVDHPNLATVYEVGETSGGYRYLVCAYYSGGSLKDRLEVGAVPLTVALDWMRQLLAGLEAAHRRGIIHRDIKPANLLLDEHGILKICDFGIAKLVGATDLTKTGASLGTPAYKSPEQAQGQDIDHRTDLWSAGVVFFELLTGRRPFVGEHEQAVLRSILSQGVPSLVDAAGVLLPKNLCHFVAQGLAKDPVKRFQNAEDAQKALCCLDDGSAADGRRSRRRLLTWATSLILALTVAGVINYWQVVFPSETTPSAVMEEAQIHLEQGRRMWLRGNHPANLKEAREHFEKAVTLDPQSAEAHGHLAAFLAESYAIGSELTDLEGAQEQIRLARMLEPKSPLADAAEAWLALLKGNAEEGERLAHQAVITEPSCQQGQSCDLAYLWLGEALWVQKRSDEAMAILETGASVGGGYIRCRLKRAQLFKKMGDDHSAEGEFLRVLQLEKNQTTALGDLGNLYIHAGRFEEATRYLRRLVEISGDAKALTNLAYALYARELWDDAVQTYRQIIVIAKASGSKNPTPYTGLGDVHLEQGEKELAHEQFRLALEIFEAKEQPSLIDQARRAVCLAKLGRFEEAEEIIQHLLLGADSAPDMLMYAARIYALKSDELTLFALAQRWVEKGLPASRFYDDPAFIPYRKDRRYVQILEPELISPSP